jgi:predicted dehydrogenase
MGGDHHARTVAVVSTRLTAGRRIALERLASTEGRVEFREPAPGAGTRAGAVLFDGPGATDGGIPADVPVVVLGCEVDGVRFGPAVPAGEVIARVERPDDPLTARIDPDFTVVDAFTPLEVTDPLFLPVLTVSHRFVDHPAAVSHGRTVVCGLGHSDMALGDPRLATLLRRALRSPRAPAAGPLGVGVVGYGPYGGMGLVHGTAVGATAGLEFVAVCDRDAGRRKAAEHDFAGVRAYATVEELAADDAVDIAVVALPPVLHASVALSLLRAGKHVVVEKPLCLATSDADALIAEARAGGRTLTVNQSRRWDRDFRAVRRAIDDGMLGEVFNVETFVGGFEHPCRAWHSEDTVSGGTVYDWGSHHIDWILALLGATPASVTATGHKRVWHDVTNLDQLRVRMRWDDGREAEFLSSDLAAIRRPKLYVQGTRGTLAGNYRPVTFERIDPALGYVTDTAHHAEAPADLVLARYESGSGVSETRLPLPPAQPFAFHRNLADHLLLGDPLAVTAGSAREVVAVLEAATLSAAAGGDAVMVTPPPA